MPDRTLLKLTALAWNIITYLSARPKESKTVHVEREGFSVTIIVNEPEQITQQIPGRILGEPGRRVWDALRPGEWCVGKEIAARLNREHDTKFKHLLQDLEERGVLLHEDGPGYSRAPLPAARNAEDKAG